MIGGDDVDVDFAVINEVSTATYQIRIETDDADDVGVHQMILKVTLVEYGIELE